MRSFALITSNTKSGRLSRSSYTKATLKQMLRSGLNHVALCADIEPLITKRESEGPLGDCNKLFVLGPRRCGIRNNRRTKYGQEENEQLQLVPSTLSTRRISFNPKTQFREGPDLSVITPAEDRFLALNVRRKKTTNVPQLVHFATTGREYWLQRCEDMITIKDCMQEDHLHIINPSLSMIEKFPFTLGKRTRYLDQTAMGFCTLHREYIYSVLSRVNLNHSPEYPE
ncbi:hypothetical protein AVEN_109251-1 [Araneus ventricosus]|uniref:Uncharacterized protein n=1 Tax=Araneus ventricosus TaxID=182803 RepID=A0A4Y2P577_ARAVE|nr:hypothetical protein AVEN_109251-1 [Araneus ventricosus]